jgi:hypothetical protein
VKVPTLLTCLLLLFHLSFAQEREIESRFLSEKGHIRKNHYKEITERAYIHPFNRQACIHDSSKIVYKYQFDTLGNLSAFSQFNKSGTTKTTTYIRNKKGEYVSKEQRYHSSNGELKYHDQWKFEYNDKGLISREELTRENKILRINQLEYDENGNSVTVTSSGPSVHPNNIYQWTSKYDQHGDLTELRDWKKTTGTDTFTCISVMKYEYENRLLIRQTKKAAYNAEALSVIEFKYDAQKNLIETIEKRLTWNRPGNGPAEPEAYIFKTLISNNASGLPLSKTMLGQDELEPIQCIFFDYELWK